MESQNQETGTRGDPIQCMQCAHFRHFHNDRGHNSPHALGKCLSQPWDGRTGQWPMFSHTCKNFEPLESNPVDA